MGAVLEFDGVSYGYANGGNRIDILKDASVSFDEIIAIFKELAHEYNKCVIVVTHSQQVAADSDMAYCFADGGLKPVSGE